MQAVTLVEQGLGNEPSDVSSQNLGWDIESRDPRTGRLRFLEVKGRIAAASTVTVTRNEILASFNQPDDFLLAIVRVPVSPEMGGEDVWNVGDMDPVSATPADCEVYYVRQPFDREPGFAEHSVNYDLGKLVEMGERMTIQE
jgi:hypothetical protein